MPANQQLVAIPLARLKYITEVLKDSLMPWRTKRWTFVAKLLDNPHLGAELGVKGGRFTGHILAAHKNLHLITVDLWSARPEAEAHEDGETYDDWDFDTIRAEFDRRTAPFADRLTVMRMSTLEAAPKVEDESLDFVFIDAEHSYEAVTADIKAWEPKVKPGGWVMGHDYSDRFQGLKRAVDEQFASSDVIVGGDTVWAVRKASI